MIELILTGNIPSKKNSRVNTRSGRSFPSADFMRWQSSAIWQIKQQKRKLFVNPVRLEVIVYFGTNVQADLDNRVTSILDMLKEAMVIQDDKWQYVPEIHAKAEYRKGKPGALLRLIELE